MVGSHLLTGRVPATSKDCLCRSCHRCGQGEISPDKTPSQVKGPGWSRRVGTAQLHPASWAKIQPDQCEELPTNSTIASAYHVVGNLFPHSGSFLLDASEPTKVDGTGAAGLGTLESCLSECPP